jgi:hemerythrin superfamily protein
MKKLSFTLLISVISISFIGQEQSDSIKAATTLEEIITICNSSGPDEATNDEEIIFERLAPYIVCICEDGRKDKKMASDYNIPAERKIIDKFGTEIKQWLDDYDNYKITKYMTQTKGNEENWHTLEIVFSKNKKNKKVIFGFIKLGDSFLLGKID